MADINAENKKIKIIAFYLPQYHAIPENDRNWGEGFTEWTNVKKAASLFEGHNQPRVPLDGNYYTLLDEKTQIWQSELAKEYGVFGFCYYHYWMKNGKMLLEKPAELMLKNKKVDLPFCFSWANENWTRNWDGGNREVIVEQDYGDEGDWKKHIEYLIPFMKDPRYITLDGSPVFLIYKPMEIPCLSQMMECWNREVRRHGLKEICFVVQDSAYYGLSMQCQRLFQYQVRFQPLYACSRMMSYGERIRSAIYYRLRNKRIIRWTMLTYRKLARASHKEAVGPKRRDYDGCWKQILETGSEGKDIEGAFTDWDNTARSKNGTVYLNASPEKFGSYMKQLIKKIKDNNQPPMVFVNAWNEWGEGAYLEPDTKFRYEYLEAVRSALENGEA